MKTIAINAANKNTSRQSGGLKLSVLPSAKFARNGPAQTRLCPTQPPTQMPPLFDLSEMKPYRIKGSNVVSSGCKVPVFL